MIIDNNKNSVKIISEEVFNNIKEKEEIIIVCIGTNRSTGDSLGPLAGHFLREKKCPYPVYGTLENPVHALNLENTICKIKKRHNNAFIIAIDACLGQTANIKKIIIVKGPIKPGQGVNKQLPPIGDLSIKGIVNQQGAFNFVILQNTNLFDTYTIAEVISEGIMKAVNKKEKAKNEINNIN